MANVVYPKAGQAFAKGLINWEEADSASVTYRVVLLNASYTYSAAHEFLSDVRGAASANVVDGNIVDETHDSETRRQRGAVHGTRTATDGILDGANAFFDNVSGVEITKYVLYRDTRDPATSRVILYVDTATGLPITPNGGDITVIWSDTTNKIFRIGG